MPEQLLSFCSALSSVRRFEIWFCLKLRGAQHGWCPFAFPANHPNGYPQNSTRRFGVPVEIEELDSDFWVHLALLVFVCVSGATQHKPCAWLFAGLE